MKFTISFFLIVSTLTVLNAQESSTAVDVSAIEFKQNDGDVSFEVNFDPGKIFGSNGGNQFNLFDGGLKFRFFTSESSAVRFGVNLSYMNVTDITQQEDLTINDLELKSNETDLSISIKPGFEKHFGGLERLSPYLGVQALIGFSTTTYKQEIQENANTIYLVKWINDPSEAGYGSLSFGAGIFAGVDFYFVKKLYLGIEVGYGVQYSSLLKSTFTNENNPSSDYEVKHGSVIGVSPSLATGNLRLGWTF